jgi:4-hydroxy-tetrahydrodipicolinate synthase
MAEAAGMKTSGIQARPFEGVWTALATPFYKGEVDWDSLKKLLRFQLDNGIEGFVVSGTTGESPTLTREEKKRILRFVLSEVAGQVPVMFGSGGNSTAESVELSRLAVEWGAESLLTVVPYYNKPPQRGLVAHFSQIAQAVDVPVMLYNVPGRTVAGLAFESVQALSKIANIVGIKEATGDVEFGKKIIDGCGPDFAVFSGDDGTCVELAAAGSRGVISVLSHLIPSELVKLHREARGGDRSALGGFAAFSSLTDLLFKEANPIPVKWALRRMGIFRSEELRLPLVSLQDGVALELREEMKKLGLGS